ncbi:MAG: tRNA guanosine(34) transglycosylase Tgt [Candidatus Kapabacteria bacterium]|nr:tRNA guanosine(34) transglycosylase Tgt [Ignavibacteriota bacterium]MCW5883820.1 tRNA guanosine(34) transglycosylase Tgt [Candidatus Kapabacteria bacterium]
MNNLYTLEKQSEKSKARAGFLNTDHGIIPTPIFMPVGTAGTVKAIMQKDLIELDAKIILGNTYHLYLRPGDNVINHFGGLHKFINWDRVILTDSGGYQIFSLQDMRKLTKEGAEFKSHIDGSKHFFSPESVVDIQLNLGSDILMVLDECVPYPADENYTAKSMELSLDWAKRSKVHFDSSEPLYGHKQFQFGIGQGGMYPNLRKEYIERMIDIDFDGNAIGGLSVGEPTEVMYDLTDLSTDFLPKDKPRYLMGVGTPENLLECIERGIDMFDCVLPTRNARNGQLFTSRGKINLKNSQYKLSDEPIDENIDSYASRNFSLGYLRHLFISQEILALQLATMHNIAFYLNLVRTARQEIINDHYESWKKEALEIMNQPK